MLKNLTVSVLFIFLATFIELAAIVFLIVSLPFGLFGYKMPLSPREFAQRWTKRDTAFHFAFSDEVMGKHVHDDEPLTEDDAKRF